jgi:hypothetical protein
METKGYTLDKESIDLLQSVSGPRKDFTNASAAVRHAIKETFGEKENAIQEN